jgi:GNAT superfamily N-acetyltransferase
MADASVRLARATDSPAMAAVQARAWRLDYAARPAMLASLDDAAMSASWRAAVVDPPSPDHRVVVALDGAAVVGLLAWEPDDDPDAPAGGVRIAVLAIDPPARGAGHGSRLLAAWADLSREGRATAGSTWVPTDDGVQREFLAAAGWAPDGAFRELDLGDGTSLSVARFVTSLE